MKEPELGVVELAERDLHAARTLVVKNIADVVRSNIGDENHPDTIACQRFLNTATRGWGRPVMMPGHLWLGVKIDGTLTAALHASPKLGEAATFIDAGLNGRPGAPSAAWVERFLNTVTSVEEIAVRPEYRRRGLARLLLQELHRRASAHAVEYKARVGDDIGHNIVAYAGSETAQKTFAALGYIVGPPRQPIPPPYVSGAKFLWDSRYDDRGGSYCYNHLTELAR